MVTIKVKNWIIDEVGTKSQTIKDLKIYKKLSLYTQNNFPELNRKIYFNIGGFGSNASDSGFKHGVLDEKQSVMYLDILLFFEKKDKEKLQDLAKKYDSKIVANIQDCFHEIGHILGKNEKESNHFSTIQTEKFLNQIYNKIKTSNVIPFEDKSFNIKRTITYRLEFVKCGKKCHCVNDEKHGPYFYMYWRKNGKLHKKYLGKINPYAIKPITSEEINELYSDLQIEKILEEKTPFEKQQEEELYQFEEYKPKVSKSEKLRKIQREKSLNKLVD